MSEELKFSAEIVLGGEKKTIQKLKAGKFYDAQKVIAEIFREASKFSSKKPENPDNKTESKEQDQIGIEGMDLGELVNLFEKFPVQTAKFVAICAEMTETELLEKAYPEEISTAFDVCLELNNVMENLKNSVAPIGKLGAQSK